MPDPDTGAAPFVNGAEFADGSPRRKRSFGSNGGRFSGSGFNAKGSGYECSTCKRVLHGPESSTSSSHKHSQRPRSSGIPHSASTIIGNGVSFAIAFNKSGRA